MFSCNDYDNVYAQTKVANVPGVQDNKWDALYIENRFCYFYCSGLVGTCGTRCSEVVFLLFYSFLFTKPLFSRACERSGRKSRSTLQPNPVTYAPRSATPRSALRSAPPFFSHARSPLRSAPPDFWIAPLRFPLRSRSAHMLCCSATQ